MLPRHQRTIILLPVVYKMIGSGTYYLNFPANTYEVFAYADPSWSFALGAQPNVSRFAQLNLPNIWPPDTHPGHDYGAHVWHSAEFRDDLANQANFWNAVLGSSGFDLK